MLSWLWSDMAGTTERKSYNGETYYCSIYKGNADLIEIYNDPDFSEYNLVNFICDKKHYENLKKDNCLIYKNVKVRLLREAFTEKELKRIAWELVDLGGTVELI